MVSSCPVPRCSHRDAGRPCRVPADGTLALLGKVPTAPDAHTVAFDPTAAAIFVGTPDHGAVLVSPDLFRPSIR